MTTDPAALVVLIDAEDVRYAFAAWPAEVCLAVCLMRDGNCTMILFRRDERPSIPLRVVNTLRLAPREIAFVPEVPGYPTRPFMYSDQRRLIALVASDPSILDEATDYMVNYTFALEEGLDPDLVLGIKDAPVRAEPSSPLAAPLVAAPSEPRLVADASRRVAGRELSPLLPEFLRKSAEQRRALRFSTVRTAPLDALA